MSTDNEILGLYYNNYTIYSQLLYYTIDNKYTRKEY